MIDRVVGRLLCVAAMAVLSVGSARGQSVDRAPAGNAHPETSAISGGDGENPFGVAPETSVYDVEAKRSFSRDVDLSPLRDLAVSHGGRVKILDTLARETVRTILGRKNYLDFAKTEKDDGTLDVEKISYDPLFSYLDMMIDPAYYADKAVVHVEFLTLREAYLDRLFSDAAEHERWKRVGRLPPGAVDDHTMALLEQHQFDPAYRQGIQDVMQKKELFDGSWRNLLMVAPSTLDAEWSHLGASGNDDVDATLTRLADAWRSNDASSVNEAALRLAEVLPAINPEVYPTTKRKLEAVYNRTDPFSYGYWMYGLALILLLLAFGTRWRALIFMGVGMLVLALAMHAFGFSVRSYIAERYAIQNQYESMTGVSLGAALIGTVLMIIKRQWLFGAAAAGVGFMVLITASTTGIPGAEITREAAILNTSVLLKYHVSTVLLSYGLICLGFIVSIFYLATHYMARAKPAAEIEGSGGTAVLSAGALGFDDGTPAGPQRVLHELDTAQMIVLQLAFWVLGVGILLGAWWADHSWGRWWAFDPKELWALITWIVYLIVIHLRFTIAGKSRGVVTAWLSVAGFVVMLWTYFGVNLLLPGLHAYA